MTRRKKKTCGCEDPDQVRCPGCGIVVCADCGGQVDAAGVAHEDEDELYSD